MEAWVPFTLLGAFFQNLRSALQKHLKGKLSDFGSAYARFCYAAPLAVIYCWSVLRIQETELPAVNGEFMFYVVAGAILQMLFTWLLVWLFSFSNFAVGTTYSKTETVQVAFFGYLVIGDTLNLWSTIAIIVSAAGVIALSVARTAVTFRSMITSLGSKTAVIGIATGAALGGSVVCFRKAALTLPDGDVFVRAAFTLAATLVFQTIVGAVWLKLREPGQITAVLRNWKWAGAVGVCGFVASVFWFIAMTMENAAYVRAVGQIELVFTFIASYFFFKERTNAIELLGVALIVVGIVTLLLLG
jgi:drug/metabolite transporter (DMT)-like permease